MRIAIISDIHGNLPALEAVLADVAAQCPDKVYCLGDLVGYGASPNEVTERIRAAGIPTIMGNYDDGVGFDRDDCGCAYRDPIDQELGDRSLAWTKAHTTADNKAFLRTLLQELRFEAEGKRVLLVHGSPRKMNEYLFEDRPLSSFQRLAASSKADVIAFGHTHKPYHKTIDGVLFVNAGSVGKPKDLDWRACWVMLGANEVTFHRATYDVAKAATAIRATELPHQFAADIETGGAPRAVAAECGSMRVLFLCPGNSARSQMAEAILRQMTHGAINVFSGGTAPQPDIHPMARQAVQSLLHVQMDEQHPKDLQHFVGEHFDYVITVCDRAAEQCPVFTEDREHIHWSFADPAAVQGTDDQRQRAFDLVARQLVARIRIWMCLPAVRDAIESSQAAQAAQ